MLDLFAAAVIALTGLYFFALGLAALLAPGVASRFLLGFASSAGAHYFELGLRLVVGGALVVRGQDMMLGDWFTACGWLVLGTTAVLLAVPWRWHRRFAERSVPQALRYLKLIGVVALAMGAIVLLAVVRGAGQFSAA